MRTVDDLPPHTRKEIEHFSQIYKDLAGKAMRTQGWLDGAKARRHVLEGRERFLKNNS
jgi:inorganic pyrophosphatase